MEGFNLADLFESVVAVVGRREAVVCPASGADGERRLTYRELDARADRLAHVLAGHGVGRDDAVGLALRNGNEYLEGMLAAFKLRAVPVDLSDRAVAAELAAVLAHADVKVVLHEPDLEGALAAAAPGVATLGRGQPGRTPCQGRPARRCARRAPATTATCSTRAGRPAGPRACCGGTRTSSSPR